MKRKIFSAIFVLTILLCVPLAANAEIIDSGECGAQGDNVTWTLDDTGTLTISGEGKMRDYGSLPAWHSNRSNIKNIIIGNGVTYIGEASFLGCAISDITFPDSVVAIGDWAFNGCNELKRVNFGSGMTDFGYNIFDGCSISEVGISDIGKWCNIKFNAVNCISNPMKYAKKLYVNNVLTTDLVIPDGVTMVGDYTFKGCQAITSVTLPNNTITNIGYEAFRDCSNLENINLGNSIKIIGEDAFALCGITSITIPDSVETIEASAFYCCDKLTDVKIPDKVTIINDRVFWRCRCLENVIIPNGITSIGERAFSECNALANITIPENVTSIGEWAFSECDALANITIPESVTYIGNNAFASCKKLTSVTIPNGITSINNNVFSWCDELTSIIIPDSVTSIGDWAFNGCDGLTDVYYSGSKTDWGNINIKFSNNPLLNATIHYNAVGTASPKIDGTPAVSGAQITIPLADVEYDSDLFAVFSGEKGMISFERIGISAGNTEKSATIPSDAESVKIFIWSSLSGMKPLCEAAEAQIQ